MRVEPWSITPDAERLIERAGRLCWDSGARAGEGTAGKLICSMIQRGHESVLEHAVATFLIETDRATSHQLVRHRLASYSQRSQRYVDEGEFAAEVPDAVQADPRAARLFAAQVEAAAATYRELKTLGIKSEDARALLPNATITRLAMTANFREWRHFIRLRGDVHAQLPIRRIAVEVCCILKRHAPAVFADLEPHGDRVRVVDLKVPSMGGFARGARPLSRVAYDGGGGPEEKIDLRGGDWAMIARGGRGEVEEAVWRAFAAAPDAGVYVVSTVEALLERRGNDDATAVAVGR